MSPIREALLDPEAGHAQRLWAAGYLRHAGYSYEEALEVFGRHSRWSNFDPRTCAYQLASVYHATPPGEAPEFAAAVQRPPRLGEPHDSFFQGAREFACEPRPGVWWRNTIVWSPDVAVYRSIEGDGHKLLVLDLDGPTIEAAWEAMTLLLRGPRPCWVKISGERGFHVVYKVREPVSYEELRDLAIEVPSACGLQTRTVKVNSRRQLQVVLPSGGHAVLDRAMFHHRRLVRGFSRHWGTGHYSVPVYRGDTLEEVLLRSRVPVVPVTARP